MIMKRDADNRSALKLRSPAPFEAETNSSLQIKLVFMTVVLVSVIWIGVLILLGREIFHRVFT
jgi:hypothetical protein